MMKSQKMKTYEVKGTVRGIEAYVDGEPLANVGYYSRSAFAIGYDCAGAGNLALSILVDYFGERANRKTLHKTNAWRYHEVFKRCVVDAPLEGLIFSSNEITNWLEIADILIGEARYKEHTRVRHSRETKARVGIVADVSREYLRQAQRVREYYGDDVIEHLKKGEGGRGELSRLYNKMKGDERVGLFIKVPRELRDAIHEKAFDQGVKMNELVVRVLTQIFG